MIVTLKPADFAELLETYLVVEGLWSQQLVERSEAKLSIGVHEALYPQILESIRYWQRHTTPCPRIEFSFTTMGLSL